MVTNDPQPTVSIRHTVVDMSTVIHGHAKSRDSKHYGSAVEMHASGH